MNMTLGKQVVQGMLKFHETVITVLDFECFQNKKPFCHDLYKHQIYCFNDQQDIFQRKTLA